MMQGWFGGLPYLLDDMRPQGFLGRNFARRNAALLQVPESPTEWREDDILYALSIMGGNFILGKTAYQRFLDESGDDERFSADFHRICADNADALCARIEEHGRSG